MKKSNAGLLVFIGIILSLWGITLSVPTPVQWAIALVGIVLQVLGIVFLIVPSKPQTTCDDEDFQFADSVVTVYDVNGEVIEKYEGRFNIEEYDDCLQLRNEIGAKHTIYFKTGTVIVGQDTPTIQEDFTNRPELRIYE